MCKRCDKEFTSTSSHKKHLLLHEEDKKRHACEKRGQCFDYPSQLERHNDVHLDKKMFKCPTQGCNKSFKRAETLKRHQIKHDKKCLDCPNEDCDYFTDLPHYLWDHMTRSHGPELVCKFYVNGCKYTNKHRSAISRHEAWCQYKPSAFSSSDSDTDYTDTDTDTDEDDKDDYEDDDNKDDDDDNYDNDDD